MKNNMIHTLNIDYKVIYDKVIYDIMEILLKQEGSLSIT